MLFQYLFKEYRFFIVSAYRTKCILGLLLTITSTGVFGKESELDKMVDSHSMAGPFALIPS